MDSSSPIGFFDSGLGGISVLKHAKGMLEQEDFIYYGDSLHAPYGSKTKEEIYSLATLAIDHLVKKNIKALVIACNTASSVLGSGIREKYKDLIIVEIEPALKPAVFTHPHANIVVMATEATLSGERFQSMLHLYEERAHIFPLGCKGLVEFIEKGELASPLVKNFLREKFAQLSLPKIDAVVLGCTHYPFIKPLLSEMLGEDTIFYDGGEGTARQLKKLLHAKSLLSSSKKRGHIEFCNSDKSDILRQRAEFLLSLAI